MPLPQRPMRPSFWNQSPPALPQFPQWGNVPAPALQRPTMLSGPQTPVSSGVGPLPSPPPGGPPGIRPMSVATAGLQAFPSPPNGGPPFGGARGGGVMGGGSEPGLGAPGINDLPSPPNGSMPVGVPTGPNAVPVQDGNMALGGFGRIRPGQLTSNLPTLPRFAQGGIVNRPTVALVGEEGPEAITPLGRLPAPLAPPVNLSGPPGLQPARPGGPPGLPPGGLGPAGLGAGPRGLPGTFRTQLMSLMKPGAVDINSPDLKPQADAFAQAQQRGFDLERAMLAERAAAEGTSGSGGFDSALQGAAENMGGNIAGFNAQLVGNQLQQQKAQMLQALQMGGTYLSEQQRNRLQANIAAIDANLRQQGLANQLQLGTGQLGLGYAQLGQQGSQFDQNLGWQMAQYQQNQNNPLAFLAGL